MPLNLLKLPLVVSLHGRPHPYPLDKWLRCQITTSNYKATPPRSAMCSSWWRITPCAPLAQDNNNNNTGLLSRRFFLGFRGQKRFKFDSPLSENTGVVVGGSMGSENIDEDKWMGSDRSFTSDKLPSQNHYQNHRQPPSLSKQQQQQHHSHDKLLTLPTILTIGRVLAVPFLVGTFYMNGWWGTTATTSIFIAAAITDWLDGYLARKMNLGSAFGAFLDPVADKLMVAATLVLLCTRPPEVALFAQMPWLLTIPSIAIIGREITMSAVREWAASQNSKLSEAVAVNNLGKWKTATQMTSLTILLATRDSSFTEASSLVTSGVALLYVSAGLAVWSLVVYMKKIWKVLLR